MIIIPIYFIFLGWISALGIHEWVPFPMFISILSLILGSFYVIKNNGFKDVNKNVVLIIYLFLLILTISFLLQNIVRGFEIKGFTHYLSYYGVISTYFFGILILIKNKNYPLKKIYKYLTWGVIFTAVFTIIEFISKNILGIDFDNFIPRLSDSMYDATYSTGNQRVIRARGPADESGHLAMYLLMFVPFVYYYYSKININEKKSRFSVLVVLIAVFLTFSAMGFFELLIASTLMLVIYLSGKSRKGFTYSQVTKAYLMLSVLIILVIYIFVKRKSVVIFNSIIGKITLTNYTIEDGGSRLSRWYKALQAFKEKPVLGYGPGISAITQGKGSTSMYFEFLLEGGIILFLVFIILVLYHLYLIFEMRGNIKFVFIFSYIVMLSHLSIISHYWFPWMWTLFILIALEHNSQTKENKRYEADTVGKEQNVNLI